ncbi:MAG: hypothetical protein AAFP76_13135 [Bacteroidota bacterium]
MKKLLFLCIGLLLMACSDDDAEITQTEVNLSINHFKTTSLLYGTALIGQEEGTLETFTIPRISGFDFQPGYTYSLIANRITTKNAGTNATTDSYDLIAVQTQDTIPPNTEFRVPLAKFVNGVGYVTWIRGNAELGYVLNNEIPIHCSQFCTELMSRVVIEENITGVFEHGPNGTYILKELD